MATGVEVDEHGVQDGRADEAPADVLDDELGRRREELEDDLREQAEGDQRPNEEGVRRRRDILTRSSAKRRRGRRTGDLSRMVSVSAAKARVGIAAEQKEPRKHIDDLLEPSATRRWGRRG